ncbi:hypothetical protein N9Y42_06720 [Mariniblastus sp.]|nr:hypothetical protein [Mariniblastus sp.]
MKVFNYAVSLLSVMFFCLNAQIQTTVADVYYVDAATGDDSNDGSFGSPFETYLPFVWTYGEPDPDIGKISLAPGDRIVFRKGIYKATFKTPDDAVSRGCYLRGVHGTMQEPVVLQGEPGAIFDAMPTEPGNEAPSIIVEQCSNIKVRNLEFTGTGRGLDIIDNQNVEVNNCWFHDIDGTDNINMEPLNVTANNGTIEIHRNLFNDNFDRINADTNGQKTENSRHIGCYSNLAYVHIHHNMVFNTDPIDAQYSGSGIVTKHAGTGVFEVAHNIIGRCWSSSVGTGSPGSMIHNNLIIEGDEIKVKDFGGVSAFNDIVISCNTMMRCDSGMFYRPNLSWYPRFGYTGLGPVEFRGNIVEDISDHYFERGTIDIGQYVDAQTAVQMKLPGNLVFDDNSYFCPLSSFLGNLYAGMGGSQESRNFNQWQDAGFGPLSAEADPLLDGVGRAMSPSAAGRGWLAGEDFRVSLFVVDTRGEIQMAPKILEGDVVNMLLLRSGDALDLSSDLTVNLAASIDDELNLPTAVTIPAGQASVQFSVQVHADGQDEGQQAIQITPTTSGFSNGISAWVRVSSPACTLGDVDLSGGVNFSDIGPFIGILSGGGFQCEADCDQNGVINFSDIAPFIMILSGS